jgi:small-conductance mechanosensitive channel
MKSEPTSGGDGPDRIEQLLVILLATGTGFVLFALFVTQGWADLVMVLLALVVPMAAYAVRHEARRQLVYRQRAERTRRRG